MNEVIGYFEIEDAGKVYKVPMYHKGNCGCTTCRLAAHEISFDFWKGLNMGMYLEMSFSKEEPNPKDEFYKEKILPYFEEKEIIDMIMNY